jgi:hypothetical protein
MHDRRLEGDYMTIVVEVEQGPYRGYRIGVRLTGDIRVKRAMALDGQLPLVIQVAHRRSRAGRSFVNVTNFWQVRPWEDMTVLGGMPAGEYCSHELSALHYNVDRHVEWLQQDLYFEPNGHTPWAAALMAEDLAYDLRIDLTRRTEPATENSGDPVERDADATWGSRTRRRIAAEYSNSLLTLADRKPRLVRYEQAYAAFCRLEVPLNAADMESASVSNFQYDAALAEHMRLRGDAVGDYRSPVWSRWIPARFDTPGDPDEALDRCRRFVTALERLDVPGDYVMVFADGSGALELMFPSSSFAATPRPGFENVAGYLALFIADWSVFCDETVSHPAGAGCVLPTGAINVDTALYHPMAQLAMPNTRSSEGDTYKVRITTRELFSCDPDAIEKLCRKPRPFDPPAWQLQPYRMLAHVWQFCVAVALCRSQTVGQPTLANRWVHEKTFDFLRCGADPDELDARVFAAALNLCDFRCPELLMESLLGPVAFACGMTVTKFTRTLANAIKKSRLARSMPIEAPPDAWFRRKLNVDE